MQHTQVLRARLFSLITLFMASAFCVLSCGDDDDTTAPATGGTTSTGGSGGGTGGSGTPTGGTTSAGAPGTGGTPSTGGTNATGGSSTTGGTTSTGGAGSGQPLGALCANDSNCSQADGKAVCCKTEACAGPCACVLEAQCPASTGYIPCDSKAACEAFGGGKVCCKTPQMTFCTKPSACAGEQLP